MIGSKEIARRRDAILCLALSQYSTDEWMSKSHGVISEKEQKSNCFIIIKGTRQFSSIRQLSSVRFSTQRTAEFRRLAEQWRREVMHLSSTTARIRHPAYQKMIQMGSDILPLLLRELAERGGHWFSALEQITGEDPTNPEDSGNVPKMAKAWIEWGRQKGHLK